MSVPTGPKASTVVDAADAVRVVAAQQDRGDEGAALGVGAEDLDPVGIAGDDGRDLGQLGHPGADLVALGEAGERPHADGLVGGIADDGAGKPVA